MKFALNSSRVCTFASANAETSSFSVDVFASLTPSGVLISTISSRGRGMYLSKSVVEIVASPNGEPPFGLSYVPSRRTWTRLPLGNSRLTTEPTCRCWLFA